MKTERSILIFSIFSTGLVKLAYKLVKSCKIYTTAAFSINKSQILLGVFKQGNVKCRFFAYQTRQQRELHKNNF